jgi:hypothetical protein
MDESIQSELEQELKERDVLINQLLPHQKILTTISDALEANKPISCNVICQSADGMADAHSMTKDFVDVPDWANRLKAADMAARLKGMYPPEKKKIEEEVTWKDSEGKIFFPYAERELVETGGNGGNGHK